MSPPLAVGRPHTPRGLHSDAPACDWDRLESRSRPLMPMRGRLEDLSRARTSRLRVSGPLNTDHLIAADQLSVPLLLTVDPRWVFASPLCSPGPARRRVRCCAFVW
jgi:hypothetical protein